MDRVTEVREALESMGLTQADFSRSTGMSYQTLSSVLNRRSPGTDPTWRMIENGLQRLAEREPAAIEE